MEYREKWRKLVVKSSVVPQQPSRLRDRWRWREDHAEHCDNDDKFQQRLVKMSLSALKCKVNMVNTVEIRSEDTDSISRTSWCSYIWPIPKNYFDRFVCLYEKWISRCCLLSSTKDCTQTQQHQCVCVCVYVCVLQTSTFVQVWFKDK